jgi:hypothetical protein
MYIAQCQYTVESSQEDTVQGQENTNQSSQEGHSQVQESNAKVEEGHSQVQESNAKVQGRVTVFMELVITLTLALDTQD